MTIKTIDTENITPEMFADISTAYLFTKDNWPLVAIKAVLEAAPAVKQSAKDSLTTAPVGYIRSDTIHKLSDGPPERKVGGYIFKTANTEERATAPLYTEPQPAIDAETRALAIEICDHVLTHTHPWAYIDEAKKLKKLLGAE